MSAPTAIFLSYAREDSAIADRIAEALRSHGLEVWFDQNELRGGEAWDQKIRTQIRTCALFIAIVSASTQGRGEGYFRREWKLAAERTHDMAAGIPFLVPVVIDDTAEGSALVPDEFMRVQWTRLPQGRTTPPFVAQIKRLLEAPRAATAARPAFSVAAPVAATPPAPAASAPPSRPPWFVVGALAMLALGAAVFFARRPVAPEKVPAVEPAKPVAVTKAAPPPAPAAPKVSDKSIAVLPFANLSTEKENEYFADGVQDDVITNLAKIRDLTVISRTSTLAYRDPASRNLKKIAGDLGVATVLEASVRRVGTKVHMNAQLIDARTDAHLWADTFDGDASDIFALQADLAQKIAAALKATLTTSERTLIERRPTENREAYGLFLRAKAMDDLLSARSGLAKYEQTAALYAQAIVLDPKFALAYARLTYLHSIMYWFGTMDPTPARRALAEAALAATEKLSPDSPETHIARGTIAYFCDNNWERALNEYHAAEVGLPNDARLASLIAFSHRRLGQWREAVRNLEHALELNPSDFYAGSQLTAFLVDLRRYEAARELASRMIAFVPNDYYICEAAARGQFALDGDRAAFARALLALPPTDDERSSQQSVYRQAILMGDYAAADRALADPRLKGLISPGGVVTEPPALHRAMVAMLRGDSAAAGRFADEVIAWARERKFAPRQLPHVALCVARAKAFAGRTEEALGELQSNFALAVRLDGYASCYAAPDVGRAYLAIGRREEALALLRQLMTGPASLSPNEFRADPLWSRLKDDPRFEEIMKSAKPL
jgi:TolB-like protein